jgi:hypothetical protein
MDPIVTVVHISDPDELCDSAHYITIVSKLIVKQYMPYFC